jgi:hypothetical protein
MFFKMFILSYKGYVASAWNRFDMFVVIASMFDLLMEMLDSNTMKFLAVGP